MKFHWSNLIDDESSVVVSYNVDKILKSNKFEHNKDFFVFDNSFVLVSGSNLSYNFYNSEYDKFGYIIISHNSVKVYNVENYKDLNLLIKIVDCSFSSERYNAESFDLFLNGVVNKYYLNMLYLYEKNIYLDKVADEYEYCINK